MSQPVNAAAGLATWQMARVLDYIEQHLPDKITNQQLARLIGTSCDRFQRAFKVSTGVSPYRFITARRLALACTLLETTREPLAQVALFCGLYDQAHFSRTFLRRTGMNPSAWRRTNGFAPSPVRRADTPAQLQM